MNNSLGVHVLGPGYGETIIIELPDGEVGIVDSFAARNSTPPALEFLHQYHPELKKLKFVAVTHPHADHLMGMSCYFDKYEIEEFWYFHSFHFNTCKGFYYAMNKKKTRDAVEASLDLPAGSIWLEALRLAKAVKTQSKVKTRQLTAPKTIQLCDGTVTAKILTPNDPSIWRYNEILSEATTQLINDGPILNPNWDPKSIPHNQASGSILFEYGETRILLMSDAEKYLWKNILKKGSETTIPKVNFIKGAHHGSKNGYYQKVYDYAADKNTILVLTPFTRNQNPLPTNNGIKPLLNHVNNIYCTNLNAAFKATGLIWKSACTNNPPTVTPAVPPDWAVTCRTNPSLFSLLESQQEKHPFEYGKVPLPRAWVHDCQKRPELILLLCQPLRNEKVVSLRPDLINEFRVGITYDNKGNITNKYIGQGVGHYN